MIYLTADELAYVAKRAVGGAVVVRDRGLLEAASARPQSSWRGVDTYSTLEAKAAALVHSLVSNHALVDGNKRLGLAALIAFLGVNGWRLTWTNDEAFDFITLLAVGELTDLAEIAERIRVALVARLDPRPR